MDPRQDRAIGSGADLLLPPVLGTFTSPSATHRWVEHKKGNPMTRHLLWTVFALLSLGSVPASQAGETSDATEKSILALEAQWIRSQKTNNPDLLAPLLADKFVNTDTQGNVRNKNETLALERASKYSSAEYPELKVIVFGDTAIATSVWKGEYIDDSGKAVSSHSRWTDTWVKMPNGKWQCVATHGSSIKD